MSLSSTSLIEKYQQALANANMGLWEFDIETNKFSWDEGLRKLYELDANMYEGSLEVWYELVLPEDHQQMKDYIANVLNGNQDINTLMRVRTKSGKLKYVRSQAYKVENNNKIKSFVGITWDVMHESTLRLEYSADLKKIQNSLVEQSKMASLGEMAAEIGHEINNPLMIIQGKTQLLLDKIDKQLMDTPGCKKALESIELNCLRIDKIIKSMRSISRKSDKDPFEAVSIFKLIEEVVEISQERFKKKKLKLIISKDDVIDYTFLVMVRPSEIVQVLVNLLNNSYDAICKQDQGWARINLNFSKASDVFHVEVTDSGAKISEEVAQKMMEPFFTTKLSGKGTGLGLSVSKQIIKAHNGDLYYDSTLGNTHFVFTLPRAQS